MPIVELCVVCSFRLPAVQRCDTRHCGSTCRVRAWRARRGGSQPAALQNRYTALRTHAASLSLAGNHHIPVVALSSLAEQEQRAESLALQLADARKRTAAMSAQLASAEQAAQADRSKHEQTIKELQESLKADPQPAKYGESEHHEAAVATDVQGKPTGGDPLLGMRASINAMLRPYLAPGSLSKRVADPAHSDAPQSARDNQEGAHLRTALKLANQQLAQTTEQRDHAYKSMARLTDELRVERQRLVTSTQPRASEQIVPMATGQQQPLPPSPELIQAKRRIQDLEAHILRSKDDHARQTAQLHTELVAAKKRVQDLDSHKIRQDQDIKDQLAQVTRESNQARADEAKAQDLIRTLEAKLARSSPALPMQSTLHTDPSPTGSSSRPEDRYDPSQDGFVYLKRKELQASAARAHAQVINNERQTARPMSVAKSIDGQAYDAAMAARWSFLADPPKAYRKPAFWSVPERVLDADSERYLCEHALSQNLDMTLKEELPKMFPVKLRRKKWW